MSIEVEVSIGEFLDKLSILEIKAARIKSREKLVNIRNELNVLLKKWGGSPADDASVKEEYRELRAVNEALWDIEDSIREKETQACFDQTFIKLARDVYVTNDRRAEIKKRINIKLGSRLHEEKSYVEY